MSPECIKLNYIQAQELDPKLAKLIAEIFQHCEHQGIPKEHAMGHVFDSLFRAACLQLFTSLKANHDEAPEPFWLFKMLADQLNENFVELYQDLYAPPKTLDG